MKTSISNDLRLRQRDRSWAKAVARSLRDWLNGFLEEAGDDSENDAEALDGSSLSTSAQSQDDNGEEQAVEQVSEGEELLDPLLASFFERAGPPEEWLKMVQEGAPQLLLPAEMGGTPWQGSPTMRTRIEMAVEKKHEAAEDPRSDPFSSSGLAIPNLALPKSAPLKTTEEPQVLKRKSVGSTGVNEPTWIQRVKQKLASGTLDAETKAETKNNRANRVSSAERAHSTEKTKLPHKAADDVSTKPLAAPRFSSVEPLVSPARGSRFSVTPPALSTSPLKQRIAKTVPTVAANRITPQLRLETERSEHNLSRHDIGTNLVSPTISKVANVRQHVGGEADIVSRSTIKSPNVEEPLAARRSHDYAPSASPRNVGKRKTTPTSPRSAKTRGYEEATARTKMAAADLTTLNRSDGRAAQQVEDLWPTISLSKHEVPEYDSQGRVGHEQKVYCDDPWPELPNNPPIMVSSFAHELRGERLRALDLEQRGGN